MTMRIIEAGDHRPPFAIDKLGSGPLEEIKVILATHSQNPVALNSDQFGIGLFRVQGYHPSIAKDKVRFVFQLSVVQRTAFGIELLAVSLEEPIVCSGHPLQERHVLIIQSFLKE